MPGIIKSAFHRHEQGFSLLELVVVALFFSVALTGILQYHHVLLRTFHHHWQTRQAWSLAQQCLDIFFISGDDAVVIDLIKFESGCQRNITFGAVLAECQEITATIITPQKHKAELSRWYCPAG